MAYINFQLATMFAVLAVRIILLETLAASYIHILYLDACQLALLVHTISTPSAY